MFTNRHQNQIPPAQLQSVFSHPCSVESPCIEWLWWSIVVNDGNPLGVGHSAEDGQLRLRDGLGGHQVGPEHRLVACWSCQASLWLRGRS